MKKLVLYISLAFVMATALGIALYDTSIAVNRSPAPLIVDPRGIPFGTHSSISDALADATNDQIIWVRNGTYYEHVVVNKSVTIKWDYISYDPALPPHRATVDGNGTGVTFNVTASNVQIFNLTTRNARKGIYLFSTATNTSIIGNLVVLNTQSGISVTSANNTIDENTLTDNNFGMHVSSSGNFLRNNNMTNNTYNFGISDFANNDVDTSNTVNGKPIYIWIDQHDRQVPSDAGYIAVLNSTNIIVEDLKFSNNDYGVRFINTYNSTMVNVEASGNLQDGIFLSNTTSCRIKNSNASYNDGTGICLHSSENNLIIGNTASQNEYLGMDLANSNGNVISGNIISHNWYGIFLESSAGNTVVENEVSGSSSYNIMVQESSGNKFYHNNIIGPMALQTHYTNSFDLWDNDAEGNYWSDYEDKYPGVMDDNGDGIWDHYYKIDDWNFDEYPLVKPWKETRIFNVAKTVTRGAFKGYNVTVQSDHVIASLNFTRIGDDFYPRQLSFNVTAGDSGFCIIIVPRAWLDGPFTLSINNIPKPFNVKMQNATHSTLMFTYDAGKHQVKIEATKSGTVPGDITGPDGRPDGKVDMRDIGLVARLFGETLPANLTPEDP